MNSNGSGKDSNFHSSLIKISETKIKEQLLSTDLSDVISVVFDAINSI